MALTETDIKIIIAAELKKQGFDKAERATNKLEKSFKRLGGTIVSVFAARKLIQFTRESAQAFAEEDRAVRSLATSMQNLGLAFEGANIEGFVTNLQRSVAVSDSQLRPALQQLVNATLDVGKAQQLLALALDISAATGKDLTAVTNGLSRAYLKDLSALARLNVGLTAAQLKTMSFEEAQAALTDRFSGQAAAAADSYAGKVASLNIAFDEAQETIGQKFIRSLELLGDGDFDKVIDSIANAADKVGNAFIRASFGVQKLKALLKGDFDQIQKLQESMNIELAGFGTKLGAAGAVQRMAQQLKVQKQIVAERKKAAALAEKEKKNQEALTKAKRTLYLEKIQIEAALKGKISEEERTRLLLMKAIAEENGTAATQLLAKLKEIQEENSKLSKQLTEFPKANDPFTDWTKSLSAVQLQLSAIQQKKIVVDFIENFVPSNTNAAIATITGAVSSGTTVTTSAAQTAKTAAAAATAAMAAGDAAATAAKAAEAIAKAAETVTTVTKVASETTITATSVTTDAAKVLTETVTSSAKIAENAVAAGDAFAETATALTEAAAAESLAEALVKLAESPMLPVTFDSNTGMVSLAQIPEINYASLDGTDPMSDYYRAITVNVNVEGNVTAEQDLAEIVYETFLGYQKSGKDLLYSSVAI